MRSEVDLMWSQSSSSSPRLVPLACPERLLGSPVAFELKSSTDTSVVFDADDFCPSRKIDARDGLRGDDLCESPGVVPYGEFG